MNTRLLVLGPALLLCLSACGGEEPPPETPPPTMATPPPGPPPAATPPAQAKIERPEAGHNLLMMTAACWFGGIWGDADGDSPDMRAQASETRCREVVGRVYGAADKGRYEQLRAGEPGVVADVASRVETLALDDPDDKPRSKTLSALLQTLAAAEREAMDARRAAARVRRDLDHEPDKLNDDEAGAVPALKKTKDLEALLKFDAGDMTHDAHALGVIAALQRLQTGLDLPKHMKVYAVEGANQLLFGVAPPDVPEDATKRLPRGAWLKYISDAAKAAGHPVPESLKTPKQREPLAWAGVLYGVSDKLRGDLDQLVHDTRLRNVVTVIATRLEAQYKSELNAYTGPPSTTAPKTAKPTGAPATSPAATPGTAPKTPAPKK